MGLVQEFKDFAMKGNVVDMAVGVIMGGAFGKIVNSVVADVLMPPIGYLIGGIKFTDLSFKLPSMTIKTPDPANPGSFVDKVLDPVSVNYGNFLQTGFDFLIIALCVFGLVKVMNRVMKKKEAPPAGPSPQEKLLGEIRDLLKARA